MSNLKPLWKCNECKKYFSSETSLSNCPRCNSVNIEEVKRQKRHTIKEIIEMNTVCNFQELVIKKEQIEGFNCKLTRHGLGHSTTVYVDECNPTFVLCFRLGKYSRNRNPS
jgi:Zn finger protein HypA/HybF involved in hydrogenase expression